MTRGVFAWAAALAAALALGDGLWRLAPGAPEDLRLAVAALPQILWAAAALRLGLPRRADAPAAEARPAPGGPGPGLRGALRRRGLLGWGARERVPLILVLGPPGAGKSSLLRRADPGLDPPEAEADGTDWWLGSDAVFVEAAAGRVDPTGLAAALSRFRPLRPVSAVLLAVSPADLTLCDALERREIGDALGGALAALAARAGTRPPVYLVLTKMDLAPGFSDAFETLEGDECDQPWGFAFPADFARPAAVEGAVAAFGSGMRDVVDAVRVRLVEALSRVDDPPRGGRLLHFGAQVALLDPVVDVVIGALLPGGRGRGAFLRGAFLTSAEQDALTIDGLLPEMSTRFAMPRSGTLPPDLGENAAGRGHFIAGLLRDIVLPEAGLAQGPRAPLHRRRSFAAAAALAAAATALAGAFGLRSAYDTSRERLALFERGIPDEAAGLLRDRTGDLGALERTAVAVDRLGAMRAGDATDGPWKAAAGGARLSGAVSSAYWRALRGSLLPHLVARLSADLADRGAGPEVLAARLAAADPAAPGHAAALAGWIAATAARAGDEEARRALLAQAPRAFALSDATAPGARDLDAARRRIAAGGPARTDAPPVRAGRTLDADAAPRRAGEAGP